MRIIIVGAGLAGLSTAISLANSPTKHDILLLESASALAEIGAGIQLTPVATREFLRWGLGDALLAASALPKSWTLRRGSDGSVLNRVDLSAFKEEYGAPYVVIHRADLHRILHARAVELGVEFGLQSKVVDYGFEEGWLQLENGQRTEADVVIACDGINSSARSLLMRHLGHSDQEWLEATGWAAYRAMAPVNDVKADSSTAEIVREHAGNCWADDQKSLMTYMVQGSRNLNLVFSHRDNVNTSDWTQAELHEEFKRMASDMDPRVRRLVDMVDSPINNWPVFQVKTLPNWVSNSGRFVLIGDAAHAMAFYLSMGVSLAVEDATALASALEQHTSDADSITLSTAVKKFEEARKPRVELIRDASLHAGTMLHLPPGRDRVVRDEAALKDGFIPMVEGGLGSRELLVGPNLGYKATIEVVI
ncbi:FAD/NAD(P)-binding domain-containing protein [Polyplosphaeria fusca]|uniref:FAD/NAD(P)-binding domain-containing protein n=1 Tax=Polyplosphaeria fusca TaxID=682080 RepID=A0A9P4UWW7_9PLEO|nr:FAD/NAD(P)-binding domain-containing protein [Polyplosphaeria fusca]